MDMTIDLKPDLFNLVLQLATTLVLLVLLFILIKYLINTVSKRRELK